MIQRIKTHYFFIILFLFFVLVNVVLFFIGPQHLVEILGVKNTYSIIFLVAAIGGLSSLTGTVFFSTMLAFAAGGANLWLLGIFGGIGLFVSDSIFFLLAHLGKKSVSPAWQNKIRNFENKLRGFPQWVIFVVLFVFLGFTPVPNDVLMIALAVGGYRYIRFFPYLMAGNITLALVIADLGNKVWWM